MTTGSALVFPAAEAQCGQRPFKNSLRGRAPFSTRKSHQAPTHAQGDPVEQGLVMADVLEARGVAAAVTQRKAAVLVCEHALDLADAGQLLDMLGLRPPLTMA